MDIENNVNVKYSTKNNITDAIKVFLLIKNHIRAMNNSIRNLAVTATSENRPLVFESFS
jgi:hypothetical protein